VGDDDTGEREAPHPSRLEGEARVIDRAEARASHDHDREPEGSGEIRHGCRGGQGNEEATCALDDHPGVSRCECFEFLTKPSRLDTNASLCRGDAGCGGERERHGADLAERVRTSRSGLKGPGVEWTVGSNPGFHRLHHAHVECASAQPAGKGARDDGLPDTRVRTSDKEAGHVELRVAREPCEFRRDGGGQGVDFGCAMGGHGRDA